MTEAVFKNYDKETFEYQYSARAQVADAEERTLEMQRWSERYRAQSESGTLNVAYGPTARERLDIFPGPGERCPVLMFIHGGYWRSRDKASYSFIAQPFNQAGATVVVAEYSLCPHVTVEQIVRQMQTACAWVWNNIDDYSSDHHKIYVMGNSAGAHLTAMLAATEWDEVDHALPGDLIKGAMGLSGLYDLSPLLLHSVNDDLALTRETAKRNSPVTLSPTLTGSYICAVGADESEEFRWAE